MATSSAERDDHEEKDEAAEEATESKAEASADEEAPAKPAAKPAKAGAKGKRAARGGTAVARKVPPPQGSSLGKSMILFVVIIGGLATGFAILGREEQTGPSKPKWQTGQTVDVEITLVKNDKNDLACASAEDIGGKHCAFEAMNKPSAKAETDDRKLLKPYTTTDRVQFAAAGVWAELPADKLPATRFSVKCKYKVEGTLKNIAVRWESTGQWYPSADWYAGSVSDCKITP